MVQITLALLTSLSLPPVMPVDDVRAGQKGECLTVFEGGTGDIEAFPFVVKGVMPNFLGPGMDVVLTRLEGDKAEFTGVVAGMSGSPCSIDGKLLGALAYSFAMFAKEPIAGIQPIGNMLDVMGLPAEDIPWRAPKGALSEHATDWKAMRDGAPVARAPAPQGLAPIATPLSLGGVPLAVQQHFAPYLESQGFMPIATGGSAGGANDDRLAPGSPIAAILVRGDVNIAATGTVTTVEGDTVTAFGHPFFGAGALSVPMANAFIVNTMASAMRSFKMSVPGSVVGEVTQDRLPAIGGYLGRKAKMIDARGQVSNAGVTKPFHFQVARDLGMTPRFVAVGLASSVGGRISAGQRGLLRYHGKIRVDGVEEPVIVADVYSAERDPGLFIYPAVDVAQAVSALWTQRFGPPPNLTVEVDVEVEPNPTEDRVVAIVADRSKVRPGERVEVSVRLRRNPGIVDHETFALTIPRSWAGSEIELHAADVLAAESLARDVEGAPKPEGVAEIGRYLSSRRSDGHLYLMGVRRGVGVRHGVDAMAFVPASAAVLMSDGNPRASTLSRGLAWEERRARSGVVSGSAKLILTVENH